MPAPFTDNANATWSTISGPVDGDPPTAASVRSPFQDLIDRTAKIKSGAITFTGTKTFSQQTVHSSGVLLGNGRADFASDIVYQKWFHTPFDNKQIDVPSWQYDVTTNGWVDNRTGNVTTQASYDHPLIFPIRLPWGAKIQRVDVLHYNPGSAHSGTPANTNKVELYGRQFVEIVTSLGQLSKDRLIGTMNTLSWYSTETSPNYDQPKLLSLVLASATPPATNYFAEVDDVTQWEVRYWPEYGNNAKTGQSVFGVRVMYALGGIDGGSR
jgi:hypothetical protein